MPFCSDMTLYSIEELLNISSIMYRVPPFLQMNISNVVITGLSAHIPLEIKLKRTSW